MTVRTAFTVALLIPCLLATSSTLAAGKKREGAGQNGGGISGAGIAEMDTVRVASGLVRPIYATHAPGDATRLFIIEKQGRIRILKIDQSPPVLLATAFLDIDSIITGGTTDNNEQGLLGLAFHPNYQANGYFYVYYTAISPNFANTVARYQRTTADTANLASGTVLLQIPDTESNHNGGWMGFKPGDTQGYLYISTGDGGGGNDQHGATGNGQNLATIGGGTNVHALLGKMLRIDIDGLDNIPANDDDDGDVDGSTGGYTSPPSNPFFGPTFGMDETWDYGLRNAWRPSFDRGTGDLYIADVGQNAFEEINFEPSSSPGGNNYGWRCMEANNCTGLTGCTCEIGCAGGPLTCPFHQYSHGLDGFSCSITGGYVYRGSAISGLQGTYFFADFCSNQIRSLTFSGGVVSNLVVRTAELAPGGGLSITSITSFGEDLDGELYICDQTGGEIFKIVPAPPFNNTCLNAQGINAGTTTFTTIAATTDGPDETAGCGVGQIHNDIWFQFFAPCTGTATVSLCGSSFDTRLAIYGTSCPTGPGQAIVCNDDACGTASEVCFNVIENIEYRVRVGASAAGVTGAGSLVLSCDADSACPTDLDDDGDTDIDDLLTVINAWGECINLCACGADIDNDGDVDIDDLLDVINAWGSCL
jgi:glucose/arabinose dehydrogenase